MTVRATLSWVENGRRPRAQRGPVAGAAPKWSACPIDRRLRLCARVVGTQHLFVVVRRRSCVVCGVWCRGVRGVEFGGAALVAVLCKCVRCARRAVWRTRARCCAVVVAHWSQGKHGPDDQIEPQISLGLLSLSAKC